MKMKRSHYTLLAIIFYALLSLTATRVHADEKLTTEQLINQFKASTSEDEKEALIKQSRYHKGRAVLDFYLEALKNEEEYLGIKEDIIDNLGRFYTYHKANPTAEEIAAGGVDFYLILKPYWLMPLPEDIHYRRKNAIESLKNEAAYELRYLYSSSSDSRIINEAIDGFKNEKGNGRYWYARALYRIQTPLAIPALNAYINNVTAYIDDNSIEDGIDEKVEKRTIDLALDAMGDLASKNDPNENDMYGTLINMFEKTSISDLRAEAADSLRNLARYGKDQRVVPGLIAYLSVDYNQDTRKKAISTLAKIDDGRAVEPLLLLLRDADQKVATKALEALNEFQEYNAMVADKTHLATIMAYKESKNSSVREDSTELIGAIAHYHWSDLVATEKKTILSHLVQMLTDKRSNVREEAARYFNRITDINIDFSAAMPQGEENSGEVGPGFKLAGDLLFFGGIPILSLFGGGGSSENDWKYASYDFEAWAQDKADKLIAKIQLLRFEGNES